MTGHLWSSVKLTWRVGNNEASPFKTVKGSVQVRLKAKSVNLTTHIDTWAAWWMTTVRSPGIAM